MAAKSTPPRRQAAPAGQVYTLDPLRSGPSILAIQPTSVLVWRDASTQLPDAEVEVLVAAHGQPDATQAYLCDMLEDGRAVFAHVNSGAPMAPGSVYAWADMPAAPKPSELAKGRA